MASTTSKREAFLKINHVKAVFIVEQRELKHSTKSMICRYVAVNMRKKLEQKSE